ncbi:hypothetical protein WJX73_003170 [Symbiochloris irregularis]|uniref:Uncharacterized protein n=1 Tax=Symbiochloris irregularis TaxID=706552 RepID=A0AAW1PNU6_9CHLO
MTALARGTRGAVVRRAAGRPAPPYLNNKPPKQVYPAPPTGKAKRFLPEVDWEIVLFYMVLAVSPFTFFAAFMPEHSSCQVTTPCTYR